MRTRRYLSKGTILHLRGTGPGTGVPVHRRRLEVVPFWTRIFSAGGSFLDEGFHGITPCLSKGPFTSHNTSKEKSLYPTRREVHLLARGRKRSVRYFLLGCPGVVNSGGIG